MKITNIINQYKLNNILKTLFYIFSFIISFHIIELIMQAMVFQIDIFNIPIIPSTDLNAHIDGALKAGAGYSLLSYIFWKVIEIYGNTLSIPILLIIIIFTTIFLAGKFIYKHTNGNKNIILYLVLSLLVYIEASMYIPELGMKYRYYGYMSGVWHNSTLISLKLMLVIFILFFSDFLEKVNNFNKIPLKDYIIISIICMFGVAFKPNFAFSIYPAFFVISIIWLIQYKLQVIKPIFYLFLSCLPSLFIMIIQAKMLFTENVGGAVSVKPFFLFMTRFQLESYISALFVYIKVILLSLLFPITVLLLNINKLKNINIFSFIWISQIISMLQAILLVEDGPRLYHGNWGWGAFGISYLLFIVSITQLINNTKDYKLLPLYKKAGIIFSYIIFMVNVWYGYKYLVYYIAIGNFI